MVSVAQKKASKKWKDSHYKQLRVDITIEFMEEIENICKVYNYSKAFLVKEAIKEKIERLESENR